MFNVYPDNKIYAPSAHLAFAIFVHMEQQVSRDDFQ